jgi:DNA-binding NtrC family response regulator
MARILSVDDEPTVAIVVRDALARAGHTCLTAKSADEALSMLASQSIDLIVSDYDLPGVSGVDFLARLRQHHFDTPVVMITDQGTADHTQVAIKAGAAGCVTAPIRASQLQLAVEQALELARLQREVDALRRDAKVTASVAEIGAQSTRVNRLLREATVLAGSESPVLIVGERGTETDVVARTIHDAGSRSQGPVVSVRCGASSSGQTAGVEFNGSSDVRAAARKLDDSFRSAQGGTIVLHEISEMSLELQSYLLKLMLQREGEPGGSAFDARIIATTSGDLAIAVAAGRFRQDLLDSLAVVTVTIPPLRERPEDIPALATRWATGAANELGKEITGISRQALAMLMSYPWPGNAAELRQVLRLAVQAAQTSTLEPQDIEPALASTGPAGSASRLTVPQSTVWTGMAPSSPVVLHSLNVDDAERVLIKRALEVTGNNRTRAATLLGMSVRTLRNKLNGPQRQLRREES